MTKERLEKIFGRVFDVMPLVNIVNEFTEKIPDDKRNERLIVEIFPAAHFPSVMDDEAKKEYVADYLDAHADYEYTRIWIKNGYVIGLGINL